MGEEASLVVAAYRSLQNKFDVLMTRSGVVCSFVNRSLGRAFVMGTPLHQGKRYEDCEKWYVLRCVSHPKYVSVMMAFCAFLNMGS